MPSDTELNNITARVRGLQQALEKVLSGSTPDEAKWSGASEFAITYNELAKKYIEITGDISARTIDMSAPHRTWPNQKRLFDIVNMNVLIFKNILSHAKYTPAGPMYNLFVSGLEDSWGGKPFQLETARAVREYTAPAIVEKYGGLDEASIEELKRHPCIFAYEKGLQLAPLYGYIRDITQRQDQIRVEYETLDVRPFLTSKDLEEMTFELDIGKLELYRTHWAVKEVNLPKELHSRGIKLPSSARDVQNPVDVSTHTFEVALSFPGEVRPYVEEVVRELERILGPNSYFYDNNYVSQLARPSLDTLLQGIYRRALLDVAFLSSDYQRKDWCGVEFRSIKEIMLERDNARVMFVRTDDGQVEGVFKTDGYVDARKFAPSNVAKFISERLAIIKLRS